MILVLSTGFVALCVAGLMLARACVPTRSVTQVLYETEHPSGTGR